MIAHRYGARVSSTLAMVALFGTLVGACGARTGLPVADPDPPGDASSCKSTEVPVLPNVPNLYFVLDASRSMMDDFKWQNVRTSVATLIDVLRYHARFGAAVFPPPGSQVNACATGTEVMALRLGDTTGATSQAFLSATALTPNGGTPTAATIRALTPELKSVDGRTYVILATDGGPNCNDALSCSVDQCTTNIDMVPGCTPTGPSCCPNGTGCLDGQNSADAVASLRSAGVQTYVMGIPGSAAYAPVLDAMAIAGGTARSAEPRYYDVTTSETTALSTALTAIAIEAMKSCNFILEGTPRDLRKVNVYVDGTLVPSDGPNGWSENGRVVTLEGTSCDAIQADSGPPPVTVFQGCPTVH